MRVLIWSHPSDLSVRVPVQTSGISKSNAQIFLLVMQHRIAQHRRGDDVYFRCNPSVLVGPGQRVPLKNVFRDRLAADQVFLNNTFKHIRRAGVIPGAIRIDQCDGSMRADLQAICLGAIDTAGSEQSELHETFFQVVPGLKACRPGGALGFALVAAQENVSLYVWNAKPYGFFFRPGRVIPTFVHRQAP